MKGLHQHHSIEEEEFREKHKEIFDEVEELLTHLGHLQAELQSVISGSISLEAKCSRFGYAAQLRAKDDVPSSRFPSSPSGRSDGAGARQRKRRLSCAWRSYP